MDETNKMQLDEYENNKYGFIIEKEVFVFLIRTFANHNYGDTLNA